MLTTQMQAQLKLLLLSTQNLESCVCACLNNKLIIIRASVFKGFYTYIKTCNPILKQVIEYLKLSSGENSE